MCDAKHLRLGPELIVRMVFFDAPLTLTLSKYSTYVVIIAAFNNCFLRFFRPRGVDMINACLRRLCFSFQRCQRHEGSMSSVPYKSAGSIR